MLIFPARRCAVVLAGAAASLLLAAPAYAHVEVTAAPARALATDAVLTLSGEAESETAGVTGVRVQLPAGLVPGDFRLTAGPAGWTVAGTGSVLTVGGPALPVGRDLRLTLRVRQLPAGGQLVLKTVQSYSDGRRDSWIELPTAAVPEPDNPAPVVRLAAAAPGATPVPRSGPASTPASTPATTPATTAGAPTTAAASTVPPVPEGTTAEPAADSGGGSLVGWLFGGVAIGLLLLGGVVLAANRRGVPRE